MVKEVKEKFWEKLLDLWYETFELEDSRVFILVIPCTGFHFCWMSVKPLARI
jgi:hypothetical protein